MIIVAVINLEELSGKKSKLLVSLVKVDLSHALNNFVHIASIYSKYDDESEEITV